MSVQDIEISVGNNIGIELKGYRKSYTAEPFLTVGFSQADYICDGTADDVQIQVALDLLKTRGGGTLLIKVGTYEITNTLNLSSNIKLIGDGYNTKLRLGDGADCYLIRDEPSETTTSRPQIKNIRLDGNKDNQSATFQGNLINFSAVRQPIVENCWFEDSPWANISCNDVSDGIFQNNRVNGGRGHGIVFDNSCARNFIFNNEFKNIGSAGGYDFGRGAVKGYGVYLWNGATKTTVKNNIITDINGFGIIDKGIGNNMIVDNILRNIALSDGLEGIKIEGASNDFICKNKIESVGSYGIKLSSANDCIIIGNRVSLSAYEGIYLVNANRNEIKQNRIFDNGRTTASHGISVYVSSGNTQRNIISDNTIYDTAGTQTWAIYEADSAGVDYNVAQNNVTWGHTDGEVRVVRTNSIADGNKTLN